MNKASLENLHQQFEICIKNNTYIGYTDNKFEETKNKNIRLTEVFKQAATQINAECNKNIQDKIDLENKLLQLGNLTNDGLKQYSRYLKQTNTWTRKIVRLLSILPKALLPSIVLKIMKAEQDTEIEFNSFQEVLKQNTEKLNQKKTQFNLPPPLQQLPPTQPDQDKGKEPDQPDQPANPIVPNDSLPADVLLDGVDLVGLLNKAVPGTKPVETKPVEDQKKPAAKPPTADQKDNKSTGSQKEKTPNDDEDPELQRFLLNEYMKSKNPNNSVPAKIGSGSQHQSQPANNVPDKVKEKEPPKVKEPTRSNAVATQEELDKSRKKSITYFSGKLQDQMTCLREFNERPLTREKFTNGIEIIFECCTSLSLLDLSEDEMKHFGVQKDLLEAFKTPDFSEATKSKDIERMVGLLNPLITSIQLKDCFEKSKTEREFITFNVQRIPTGQDGKYLINRLFKNDKNERVLERNLGQYAGTFVLNLSNKEGTTSTDEQALNLLNDFIEFLKENKDCHPNKVVVDLENRSLTKKLFDLLLQLNDKASEIQFDKLKELDLLSLTTTEDESKFIKNLHRYHFSNLEKFRLAPKNKSSWDPADFTKMLAICPTIEFFKICFSNCSAAQEITIPEQLLETDTLELNYFPREDYFYLCSQFKQLKNIDLRGSKITDDQLNQLIFHSRLEHVESLDLTGCKNLTTDILRLLPTLEHLETLSLPDLPKGQLDFNEFPSLDNPFKIRMFYTASQATHAIASNKYTGPNHVAAIFQIPLAFKGVVQEIFPPTTKILDPKSVAYWLCNDEFRNLEPQLYITDIIADSNESLTPQNLTDFVQKFPNANRLSLYNCPNITNESIIEMLKVCRNIKKLDLTGCHKINSKLICEDNSTKPTNLEVPNSLSHIWFDETSMDGKILEDPNIKFKWSFSQSVLTIDDSLLTDPDSLEKKLKDTSLNILKRVHFTNCKNLTNEMLNRFLNYFNEEMWKKETDGVLKDNPQRLNLAVLDLTGCEQITEEAFLYTDTKGKKTNKIIPILDRVIINGTGITDVTFLEKSYPSICFQQVDAPLMIEINPERKLAACLRFHEIEKLAQQGDADSEKELAEIAPNYVHARMIVEIFASHLANLNKENEVSSVLSHPINPNDEMFSNFTITYKVKGSDVVSVYKTTRDALLSQSVYFLRNFRPGGHFSKLNNGIALETKKSEDAPQIILDLLTGKMKINEVDFQTGVIAAEPVGSANFNLLKNFYEPLRKHLQELFEFDNAEYQFEQMYELQDEETIKFWKEKILLPMLKKLHREELIYANEIQSNQQFRKIANIARTYKKTDADALLVKVNEMEDKMNQLIANDLKELNNQDNEKYTKAFLAKNPNGLK